MNSKAPIDMYNVKESDLISLMMSEFPFEQRPLNKLILS